MNQLFVAFLLAAKKTSLQTNVGYIFMLASMPLTYLILAPEDWAIGGLHGGAVGLAVEIVVMQSFQLLLVYVINRYTPISLPHYFYFFNPYSYMLISISIFYLLKILGFSVYLSMVMLVMGCFR